MNLDPHIQALADLLVGIAVQEVFSQSVGRSRHRSERSSEHKYVRSTLRIDDEKSCKQKR